jgi:autotransporter-associated beta strand protein
MKLNASPRTARRPLDSKIAAAARTARPILAGTVAMLLAGAASSGTAQAASAVWTGAVDTTWAGANWSNSPVPGTGETATFNGAGNGNTIIDLGAGVTIGNISFLTSSAAAYTIGSGAVGSQTLTLNDSGAISMGPFVTSNELVNAALTLGTATTASYTLTNNSPTNTLTFKGDISGGTGGTAGTKTLTISGAGNTVFSGNLNKGSATDLNLTKIGSGTFTVNPTANVGSASGTVAVNAGKLAIDFTNAGANGSLLSSFSPLSMGGGTLQIIGNASNASTQTFGSTAIASGLNVISVGTNNPTLNLKGYTQTLGTALRFDGLAYNSNASGASTVAVAALGTITTTTSSAATLATAKGLMIVSATARSGVPTVGLYDWASTNLTTDGSAGTSPYTIVGGTQVPGFYTTQTGTNGFTSADANFDITGTATAASGSIGFAQTVRFNTANTTTFTANNGANGFWTNGILLTPNVGNNNVTFTGNFLKSASVNNTTNGAITMWQNNTAGELIINTVVANKTNATIVTKAGEGTLVLGAVNTYTGVTNLFAGNALVTANSGFGAVGTGATVNLNGGTAVGNATFTMDNAGANKRPFALGTNGGGLAATAGNTVTISGVVSGAAGTGPLVIGIPSSAANGNSTTGLLPGTGSGTPNAALNGTGTVVLNAANTYSSGTAIVGGATLNFNALAALGGTNYGGITFNGGTLQYAASNTTDVSVNTGTGATYPGLTGITLASGGGTIDTNGNNVTYANSIGNGGTGGLTKKGTGTLTLSGANSYTGATSVTLGKLALATGSSLANTAVSVSNGATLTANSGAASNIQIGTTGASLNLNAGAIFSMVDAAIGTTTINSVGAGVGTVLTLGGTAATPASLSLELGSTGADQLIVNNGTVSFAGTPQENITLTALGATAPGTLTGIPLLSVPNGTLTLGNFSLQTQALSFGANNYVATLVLGAGNTQLQLNLQQVVTTPFYWTGGTSNSWATASNFADSNTGLTPQGGVPLAANNVFETADNAAGNFTQVVGTTSINSLSFTGTGTPAATNSVTLGSGTLTLNAGVAFTDSVNSVNYPVGTGLVVQSGSAAHTISANVTLGASQTWEIDNLPAAPLTVSGNVTGSGKTLTKTGNGKLILSGTANSYAGTVISAGTVVSGATNALSAGSALTVAGSGSTFDLGGFNQSLGTIADGGVATGTVTSSSGTPTLTVNNSTPNTFSGTISGPLTLAATGTSSLTLSGANTYSGPTNISGGGTVKISAANNLGDGSATNTISLNASTLNSTSGTYALGPNRTVALTGTGTVQVDAGALTVDGVVSGSALTKTGAGTLALSGTNTYSGQTSVNGGVLQFGASNNLGDASATNTLSFNGGTLELTAGTVDLLANRTVALPGAATFLTDPSSALTVSGAISGAGTLTKTGTGSLSLTAADTATGATTVSAGTLTVGATGSINGTPSITVANAASLSVAGSVTLPNTAAAFTANVNSKVYVSGGSFSFSNANNINNNTQFRGLFTQTGGTVTTAMVNMSPNATETSTLYVGGNGSFIANDGQFSSFTVGTRGVGSAYVSGSGSLTVNSTSAHPMIIGSQFNSGGADVGGGAGTSTGQRTFVQQGGTVTTGHLTLGSVQISGGNVNPGVYYLNGGSLTTGTLNRGTTGGTSGGTLNFGGGTFKNSAAFSTDANVATNINSGGATIDTTGGDLTWSGVIAAGTTGNVRGFTGLNGGSGYTTAPTVVFDNTGTGGTGATGTAIIDANGAVTDVVITNPGSGYTSTPTFTFTGGGGSGASVTGTTIATGNGGLTKTGTNALTLAATNNSYTGPTTVTGGTLNLTGSLSATTSVNVTSGSVVLSSGERVFDTATLTLGGGSLGFATGVSGATETLTSLTVSASGAVLDFGLGDTNKFVFSIGAGGLSLGSFQLSIYNWTGSTYSSAATNDDGSNLTQDRLLFAGSTVPANLANVLFYSDAGTTLLGSGHEVTYTGGGFEVVPVPEPSSLALLAGLGLFGLGARRFRARLASV